MAEGKSLTDQENNGFGPSLFRRTGFAANCFSSLLLVVSFALMAYFTVSDSKQDALKILTFVFVAGLAYILMFVVELLRRVFLFPEEYSHRVGRYQSSGFKAFKATFAFPKFVVLVVIVALLALVFSAVAMYENVSKNDPKQVQLTITEMAELCAIILMMMPALSYLTGLHLSSLVEHSDRNEKQDKNVADGLAWSYYFGYLKLVLPKLQEKLREYEHRELITIPKMIILVPRNCFTYGQLKTADKNLEPLREQTPELKVNRGGIIGRVYKHTVYKITTTDKVTHQPVEYHCLIEYATPLMSLYDMSEHPEAGLSREERETQARLFINRLTDILNREEAHVKGTYMLLPFSGEKDTIAETVVKAILQDQQAINM